MPLITGQKIVCSFDWPLEANAKLNNDWSHEVVAKSIKLDHLLERVEMMGYTIEGPIIDVNNPYKIMPGIHNGQLTYSKPGRRGKARIISQTLNGSSEVEKVLLIPETEFMSPDKYISQHKPRVSQVVRNYLAGWLYENYNLMKGDNQYDYDGKTAEMLIEKASEKIDRLTERVLFVKANRKLQTIKPGTNGLTDAIFKLPNLESRPEYIKMAVSIMKMPEKDFIALFERLADELGIDHELETIIRSGVTYDSPLIDASLISNRDYTSKPDPHLVCD